MTFHARSRSKWGLVGNRPEGRMNLLRYLRQRYMVFSGLKRACNCSCLEAAEIGGRNDALTICSWKYLGQSPSWRRFFISCEWSVWRLTPRIHKEIPPRIAVDLLTQSIVEYHWIIVIKNDGKSSLWSFLLLGVTSSLRQSLFFSLVVFYGHFHSY